MSLPLKISQVLMCAGLLSVVLAGPARADVLLDAWERELPPELSGDEVRFGMHNLRLVAARPGGEGPALFRALIRQSGLDGEVEPINTAGLPPGLEPLAIKGAPGSGHLFLAGEMEDGVAVYRAPASASAEVEDWVRLPSPRASADAREHFVELIARDGFLYLFTLREAPGAVSLAGWVAPGAFPLEDFEWEPVPMPETPRAGHAVLMTHTHAVLAGGRTLDGTSGEPGEAAPFCELSTYEGTRFSPWERTPIPVPRQLTDVVSASGPGGMLLAPRLPREGDDAATSMTIHLAAGSADVALTEFHPVSLGDPPAPVHAMLIDSAHSWLLLVTEAPEGEELSRLSAWRLPRWLDSPITTEADQRRAQIEAMILPPVEMSLDETLSAARTADALAMIVITGDDPDEQLEVLGGMNNPRFRYMTRGMVHTYLSGEKGQEARARYGIGATPAYLVLDPAGNVAAEHTGSTPLPSELFQLTSPSRIGPAQRGAGTFREEEGEE